MAEQRKPGLKGHFIGSNYSHYIVVKPHDQAAKVQSDALIFNDREHGPVALVSVYNWMTNLEPRWVVNRYSPGPEDREAIRHFRLFALCRDCWEGIDHNKDRCDICDERYFKANEGR